jgi:5-formyltetrahydrofolate cyclo-ligase
MKSELRTHFKFVRDNIPLDLKIEYDKIIVEKIKKLDIFKTAETLLVYYPVNSEIDITPLFESGKIIALPKIIASEDKNYRKYLEFFEYKGETVPGEFDIPVSKSENKITNFRKTLAIIPALSIDKRGYRLGYGGGYYDMFSVTHPLVRRVGVCYKECLTETLPNDKFDIQVDIIITD